MTPTENPRWCPPNSETSFHQRFLSTAKCLRLKGAHLGEELERLWSLVELIWFIQEHWMKWRRGEEETIKQRSLCFKSWHHFQPLWSRSPASVPKHARDREGFSGGNQDPESPRGFSDPVSPRGFSASWSWGRTSPDSQERRRWHKMAECGHFVPLASCPPNLAGMEKYKPNRPKKDLKIKSRISQKQRGRFSITPQHYGDPQCQFEPLIRPPARNPRTQKAENRPKTHLGHTLRHGKAIKKHLPN